MLSEQKCKSIDLFLNAKTIAIIGASEKPGYSLRFMQNIISHPFEGQLFPVNPKYDTLFDLPCYASIKDIGAPVDLAVIIVKAKFVEDIVQQCADSGVGACLIITAGFKEVDPVGGKEAELRLKAIAGQSGMHICGPNTIGSANIATNVWMNGAAGISDVTIKTGHSAIISQSGAAGFGPLLSMASDYGVGFKYIVTTGNEADLDLCDFLAYMLTDGDIRSIALLIEGVKDGKRLVSLMQRAQKQNVRLVLMKLGESPVGERAAASHTASLTGDMNVFNALVEQYGAIKAEDYDELIIQTRILQPEFQLQGKRLCAISHSGGISGFLGDQLSLNGFDIPVFSQQTQNAMNEYLQGFGSPRNPLDVTSHILRPTMVDILSIAEQNEDVDGYVVATHNGSDVFQYTMDAVAHLKKPCFMVWTGSMHNPGLPLLQEGDYPFHLAVSKMARMLGKAYHATNTVQEKPIAPLSVDINMDVSRPGYLNEVDAKAIASSIGIAVPRAITVGLEQEKIAPSFEGPYALKIVSGSIIHKSDIGGVQLNLQSADDIAAAREQMLKDTADHRENIDGLLIEQQCPPGLDVMVGLRADAQYGHVLAIGLGGIYTELMDATAIGVLPLSTGQIERMIASIPLLDAQLSGYRGGVVYDKAALLDAIANICAFAGGQDERLALFEINPLRVLPQGKGVVALDCVISLEGGKS